MDGDLVILIEMNHVLVVINIKIMAFAVILKKQQVKYTHIVIQTNVQNF